jgi:putative ABC transport system permease protein
MVLTFAVVLISSWRVSRLNVVRAVRDIPEPDKMGRSFWGVIVAVLLPLAGAVAFWQGLATDTMAFYLGGVSLVLIGAALLARVLGASRPRRFQRVGARPARPMADPGLHHRPGRHGAWARDVLRLRHRPRGRGRVARGLQRRRRPMAGRKSVWKDRGLPPVLKTAVKYPTQSLFRTGMTLAMFMLVVFTLTAMNFIQAAMGAAFGDTQKLSGGYEIQGNAGYADPRPKHEGGP